MLHKSPCFISLVIVCFFIGSTTSLSFNDEYASTQEEPYNAKETLMIANASTTNKQNKSKEETTLRTLINSTKVLNQEILEQGEKTPNRPSSIGHKVVNKCDHASKVSSQSVPSSEKLGSRNGGFRRVARKLLPRQQDVDAFVAYADYRGPRRHPPRNN